MAVGNGAVMIQIGMGCSFLHRSEDGVSVMMIDGDTRH